MKKLLTAGGLILLLTGCACAADAVSRGFISVNVEKTEEFPPNAAKVSFAVVNQSQNPESAAEANKTLSIKVIEAVKKMLDEKSGETIKTTSYIVNPEYKYKSGTKELTGYIATNTLEVQLKNGEKAGEIISAALSNGANKVNNLQFILDENGGNCNILIAQATKEAKNRAEKIAEASGSSISGIKSISAGCSTSQNSNIKMFRSAGVQTADFDGEASMPVEPGKVKLRAYVNAEYYVK